MVTEERHVCLKCGKTQSWNQDDKDAEIYANQWHRRESGKIGYGSNLEGCVLDYWICDGCLNEWLEECIHKEDIYKTNPKRYEDEYLTRQ